MGLKRKKMRSKRRSQKHLLIGRIALALALLVAPSFDHASIPTDLNREIASVSPSRKSASKSDVLSRLTEEMFQRAEVPTLTSKANKSFPAPIGFSPISALSDPSNKISPEFKVPEALRKRTEFWFNIYTKYGDEHHVIHHVLYPWIVFDVVDTSEIENNDKLHKWTKYHRAKALVAKQKREVRLALKKLARKNNFSKLTGLEKKLYDQLAELPGKRSSVFKAAAYNVRSQLGQKDFFIKGLSFGPKYLPYMEEEFQAAGLPTELTRIPFVESSFNVHAESKVGASGIWQIMPRTGRAYLIVTDEIDERNSPLKASLVAIEVLKRNEKVLKDWPLAVTAYNHGASGLKKNLKLARATTLDQLINRRHSGSFKFASANFYTSFLAVLHAEKYQKEIFQDLNLSKESPIRYSVYKLDKKMRAKGLLKTAGVDHETFLAYNLDLKDALKQNAWVPKGFKILVPFERRYELDAKIKSGLKPVREAHADPDASKPNSKGS